MGITASSDVKIRSLLIDEGAPGKPETEPPPGQAPLALFWKSDQSKGSSEVSLEPLLALKAQNPLSVPRPFSETIPWTGKRWKIKEKSFWEIPFMF